MFSERYRGRINLKTFVLEVTQDCNQRCCYCYNVWKHREYPKGELGIEEWKNIVLRLKRDTRVKLLSISGGEPMLYPQTIDLIRFIRSQKIKVNLLTNGSLIDERAAEDLVEAGVSLFEVPLISADRVMHSKLKGKDDFDSVVEGIANLFHSGGHVITAFVATKENIAGLEETLEFSIALGSKGMMFNRINPACKEHIPLLPSKDQLLEALNLMNDFSRKHRFPITCSIPIQPCIIDMKGFPKIPHGYCPSGNENSYYTIDPIGNVRICNHSPTILGNVMRVSIREIIGSLDVSRFRDCMPQFCTSCTFSATCRGGCKASAQVCYGSLNDNDPFLAANLDKLKQL